VVDFSGLPAVEKFGSHVFNDNLLRDLDLTILKKLKNIGIFCFYNNPHLATIKLPSVEVDGVLYSLWKGHSGQNYFADQINSTTNDKIQFFVLQVDMPQALDYFTNVQKIESDRNREFMFCLNNDSLWVSNSGTDKFSLISLPYPVSSFCLTSSDCYVTSQNFFFRLPLENIKAKIYTRDFWGWDTYTECLCPVSKPSDSHVPDVLGFVRSYGSRSGWNIFYSTESPIERFGWGWHEHSPFLDKINPLFVYVSKGSNHQRYDIVNKTWADLNEYIVGAFSQKKNSFLVSTNKFSIDFGSSWQNFNLPEQTENFYSNGFTQLNDSLIAVADLYKNSIYIIRDSKFLLTTTKIPAGFRLLNFDGSFLWGKISKNNTDKIVRIPFSSFGLEEPITSTFTPTQDLSQKLSVYPNPTNGHLEIEGLPEGEITEITLYNINSKLVKKQIQYSSLTQMDISDVVSGVYLLVFNNRFNNAVKIIKR